MRGGEVIILSQFYYIYLQDHPLRGKRNMKKNYYFAFTALI